MSERDDREHGRVRLAGLPPVLHPLHGCGYRRFWAHYFQNWPYNLRSLYVRLGGMVAITARLPLSIMEARKHNAAIAKEPLEQGPVFLIGHWRSGTTHLHNLLSQDEQFAWISFSRSAMPLDCLGKLRLGRHLMNLTMPKTRGMDSVPIDADTPQEEEVALAALGDTCFFKCFYFPRKIEEHFDKAVLMRDLKPGEREKLAANYRFLAQKMAYAYSGKTVLFKNPASTARMGFLKEVFPNAKFVHIVRNPYDVYPSMMKLWPRLLSAFSWHNPRGIDFSEITLSFYEKLMQAHLAERENIPAEDFHEVRYEDLDRDPQTVIDGIYKAFDLPQSDADREAISAYIDSQSSYQKNTHELPDAIREAIADRWAFAFERWGYER